MNINKETVEAEVEIKTELAIITTTGGENFWPHVRIQEIIQNAIEKVIRRRVKNITDDVNKDPNR